MVVINDILKKGIAAHKAGKIHEADSCYTAILKIQPKHPDANHNLGVLAVDIGKIEQALPLFKTALKACTTVTQFWLSYIDALIKLDRRSDAKKAIEQAKENGVNGDAFDRLSKELQAAQSALSQQSDPPQDQINTLIDLYYSGQMSRVEKLCKDLLQKFPNSVILMNISGAVLLARSDFYEAVNVFTQVIQLKPDYAEAYNNRGLVLKKLGRYHEALNDYAQAIQLRPDYVDAYNNRGLVFKELGRYQEALNDCTQAIRLKPDFAGAHNNLGIILRHLNNITEAIGSFREALRLKPDFAEAHHNYSLLLLLAGDYAHGFKEYEWRWKTEGYVAARRNFMQPLWLGKESLERKKILIHSEQGLGDTIQFSRYIPLVAGLGAKVIFEIQGTLYTLFENASGIYQLIRKGEALPSFDYHIPIMSLPLAFNTRIDTIPSPSAYLKADRNRVKDWEKRLLQSGRPKIGLAWSGNSNHKNDTNRSTTLKKLIKFLPKGLHYICLHHKLREEDQVFLNQRNTDIDFFCHELDFDNTAALCSNLDLIISVDTSLAHLSAALGRPTWVILPLDSDWRWLTDRSDSPWYSAVRLFREYENFGGLDNALLNMNIALREQYEVYLQTEN